MFHLKRNPNRDNMPFHRAVRNDRGEVVRMYEFPVNIAVAVEDRDLPAMAADIQANILAICDDAGRPLEKLPTKVLQRKLKKCLEAPSTKAAWTRGKEIPGADDPAPPVDDKTAVAAPGEAEDENDEDVDDDELGDDDLDDDELGDQAGDEAAAESLVAGGTPGSEPAAASGEAATAAAANAGVLDQKATGA